MNKAEKYKEIAEKSNKEYYSLKDILKELKSLAQAGEFVHVIPFGVLTKKVQQCLLDEGFTIESNKNENYTIISWY